MNLLKFVIATLCVTFAVSSHSQETAQSSEVFLGKNFATLVMDQEKDGKRGFRLIHNKPNKADSKQSIQLGAFQVEVQQFPFEKGVQTLLYRFKAVNGKEDREILVLYSGLLGLMAGGEDYYFYVAEEYKKSIRYYAMYKGQPQLETLTKAVELALLNPDSALVATKWAGKESEIFIYDSTRLTK